MSVWRELRRRNVFKVAAAWLVAAWLIIQVIGQISDPLGLPESLDTIVIILLAIGFPFALIAAWIYEVTPEGIRVTPDAGPEPARSGQRLNYVIAGLLAIAVALLSVDVLLLDDGETSMLPRVATTDGIDSPGDAARTENVRLAVLPLADNSPDGDKEYLADGITSELISTLSLIDGIDVPGLTSSLFFKGRDADLATVREALDIDYALEGDVRSSGDQLRVSVQLTDAISGAVIYSEPYEGSFDDVFALQDEIARDVAESMQIALGVGDVGGRLGMTRNPLAFDEYSRAQALARQFGTAFPQVRRTMLQFLERAVALDDEFAIAWFRLYFVTRSFDEPELQSRSEFALNRVRELTPDMPELIAAQLNSAVDFFDAARIVEEYLAAAEQKNYPPTELLSVEQMFMRATGRISSAIPITERLAALNPLEPGAVFSLSMGYLAAGRYSDAMNIVDDFAARAGELNGNLQVAAIYAALASGDAEAVTRRVEAWAASAPANFVESSFYDRLPDVLEDPQTARAELRGRWTSMSDEQRQLNGGVLAPLAAQFGDSELAIEMLSEVNESTLLPIVSLPFFSEVRATPQFRELIDARGFVSFWRETGQWPDFCRPLGLDEFECF